MNAVIWQDRALDRLADVWVAATPAERAEIERDVAALNRRLAADPAGEGESRTGRVRVVIDGYLTVYFELYAAGVVRVTDVRRPA